MIRAIATRLALSLLALTLTAGCTGTPGEEPDSAPPSSSTTASDGPTRAPRPPAAPPADACYRLSYDQAVAPSSRAPAVPCRGTHAAETFHVGRLERVVAGRLLAVDSRRLQDQVATTCPRLLPAHVGGSEEQRRLSMVRAVWFTPTLAESDAGADWFRCDVVALSRDSELLEVTGSLSGVLDTEEGRARFAMCGTAEPGTEGFARVACSETHTWRALRTVILPGPDYPGEEAAERAGEEPCRGAARAQAPDPLDFQWGYEWPTAEQWRAGQTYGICWAPAP